MTFAGILDTAAPISLGPRIVGATFLVAGAIKAVAPYGFSRHLASLGLIPQRLLPVAVTVTAAVEAGLAVALLMAVDSSIVWPSTLALLFGLSALSWWGVRSGKATDCGCYGSYFRPSIRQSLGLNAVFAIMVSVPWILGLGSATISGGQVASIFAATITAGMVAAWVQAFEARNGRPPFDLSPLKSNRRWRHGWAAGMTSGLSGETLVSFLGPECPHCRRWVRVLNAIDQSPQLPKVIGVTAASRQKLDQIVAEQGIRFPVALVSRSLVNRLTRAVPTTVLVEGGKIRKLWMGELPAEFFERFRTAFFPQVAQPSTSAPHRPQPSSATDQDDPSRSGHWWLFPAALSFLAALYLVQVASPLRLAPDAVTYLGMAARLADGLDVSRGSFPLGYPYFLSLLDKAGIASSATFILANCFFLAGGLVAVWYLTAQIPGASRQWTVVLTLLATPVVQAVAMPLSEAPFFSVSLIALACMTSVHGTRSKWRPLLLVLAVLFTAAAVSLRVTGALLVPALIVSFFPLRAAQFAGPLTTRVIGTIAAFLTLAVIIFLANTGELSSIERYLTNASSQYSSGSILSHVVERALTTLMGIGELAGNVPTTQVDKLTVVYPWVGAAVGAILLLFRPRLAQRITPVSVYAVGYFAVLFLWPHYTPRLWMPVLPIMIAYATAAARRPLLQPRFRYATMAGIAWFCVIGFTALAYTSRISLSGRQFPRLYGTAGGLATPGYEQENPGYNAEATRLLRRYGSRFQRGD